MADLAIDIFVYGTLKPGERAFAQFCEPFLTDIEPALAAGRLYHLPQGYPAMTLEPGWVQGFKLSFTDPAVLLQLDEFEEFWPDRPLDSEYQRLHQTLYSSDYRPFATAWTYVMARSRVEGWGGVWLPQGFWSQGHLS